MRYRLQFSLFVTVIAVCIVLPAVSSGSRPAVPPEDYVEQPSNALCRASLTPTHHMSGFPMLFRNLIASNSELSVLSFNGWIRISSSTSTASVPLAPASRIESYVTAAAPAQVIDVSVGPGGQVAFEPSVVSINFGDTVRWTFATVGHNVISGSSCTADNRFCSPNDANCGLQGSLNAGEVYTHTFNPAGTFP